MDKKRLTSENGKPIADNQNIQTADVRGPAMLQDVWYLEKLAHFDREVIPERQRIGSFRDLHRDARHHQIHPGLDLFAGG